jgi:peptidoglycan/xylan/chitin deacetylase (PgdA/CDA1 family)
MALTFDAEHPDRPAGPPEQYGRMLDALQAAGARATFFVQGRWARSWPAVARRIARDGHLVGLHCHSHVPYPWLSAHGVAADLAAGRRVVTEACGVDPAPWFRLPYGKGVGDPVLHDRLRAAGFRHVHWSVNSRDWAPEADAIVERVSAAASRATRPEVVLFHTWPARTAAALPALLARLRSLGVEFVTVDELAPAYLAGRR